MQRTGTPFDSSVVLFLRRNRLREIIIAYQRTAERRLVAGWCVCVCVCVCVCACVWTDPSMRTVAGYHTPEVDAVTTEAPGTACGMHEENPVHAHLVWLEEQKVQL